MNWKPKRFRIHLTNGKKNKIYTWTVEGKAHQAAYDYAYCGETYESFCRVYEHSMYTFRWYLNWGAEYQADICPECFASSELGSDILGTWLCSRD
jgi:hypothetical protein